MSTDYGLNRRRNYNRVIGQKKWRKFVKMADIANNELARSISEVVSSALLRTSTIGNILAVAALTNTGQNNNTQVF